VEPSCWIDRIDGVGKHEAKRRLARDIPKIEQRRSIKPEGVLLYIVFFRALLFIIVIIFFFIVVV